MNIRFALVAFDGDTGEELGRVGFQVYRDDSPEALQKLHRMSARELADHKVRNLLTRECQMVAADLLRQLRENLGKETTHEARTEEGS